MNSMLDGLYEQLDDKYFVPVLTKLHGDCLFESLIYHGIGTSVLELRKGLACLIYMFKDYKGFFPGNSMSMSEMFGPFNEIEYVVCRNKAVPEVHKKFFKYTFNAFKVFVVAYWNQIDYDLDAKTRKKIEEVFELENSIIFRLYQFTSLNLSVSDKRRNVSCEYL